MRILLPLRNITMMPWHRFPATLRWNNRACDAPMHLLNGEKTCAFVTDQIDGYVLVEP
jgi:hypothetical protein